MADFIPTVTRDSNGFLTLDWPTNQRGETMVAREVMVQMVDDLNRLRAEGIDLRQQLDVLKIELAQARTGKALLEVERLEAENRELRERLAAGFASSVVIDVSHDDAARLLRQVMRSLEKITGPDGGMQ